MTNKKRLKYIKEGAWRIGKYRKAGSRHYLFRNDRLLVRLTLRDLKNLKKIINKVEEAEDPLSILFK